jgi:DNA-directed RNA polymerase specialized sigma24 family protein
MEEWTNNQIIERFLVGQEAFRVLIQRHGPMVLSTCRRILGDEHVAEDAFQAKFAVLAGELSNRDLLTNWLHGMAWRVSKKERVRSQRRRVVERQAAEVAHRVRRGRHGERSGRGETGLRALGLPPGELQELRCRIARRALSRRGALIPLVDVSNSKNVATNECVITLQQADVLVQLS